MAGMHVQGHWNNEWAVDFTYFIIYPMAYNERGGEREREKEREKALNLGIDTFSCIYRVFLACFRPSGWTSPCLELVMFTLDWWTRILDNIFMLHSMLIGVVAMLRPHKSVPTFW